MANLFGYLKYNCLASGNLTNILFVTNNFGVIKGQEGGFQLSWCSIEEKRKSMELRKTLRSGELAVLEKEVSKWFTHWVGLGWFTMPKNRS